MNQENKTTRSEHFDAMMKVVKTASIGVAAAIVIACFAFTQVEDLIFSTVLYGVASLLGTVSMIFIIGSLSMWRAVKNRRNFFLYDKKAKADIPVSALSFEEIRRKLKELMSIFKRKGKIYIGDLFSENSYVPEQFKTLFCYEILYELALEDGSIEPEIFLSFGSECAAIFSKYLRENGDYELASDVCNYLNSYSKENSNAESFRSFIKNKKEYIEKKMLGYTVDNIDKFN